MGDRFERLADEFGAKIRAARVDGSARIALVFHWSDANGPLASSRVLVENPIGMEGVLRGDPLHAAYGRYVAAIVEDLRARLQEAPEGLTLLAEWPRPVYVRDVGLEIGRRPT